MAGHRRPTPHRKFLSTPSARRATMTTCVFFWVMSIFLSTPSARRATLRGHPDGSRSRNFYPRPPRGGRLLNRYRVLLWRTISIHALREEGDVVMQFAALPGAGISIHALREEGDWCRVGAGSAFRDFYPRPPRGGRRQKSRSPPPAAR